MKKLMTLILGLLYFTPAYADGPRFIVLSEEDKRKTVSKEEAFKDSVPLKSVEIESDAWDDGDTYLKLIFILDVEGEKQRINYSIIYHTSGSVAERLKNGDAKTKKIYEQTKRELELLHFQRIFSYVHLLMGMHLNLQWFLVLFRKSIHEFH